MHGNKNSNFIKLILLFYKYVYEFFEKTLIQKYNKTNRINVLKLIKKKKMILVPLYKEKAIISQR